MHNEMYFLRQGVRVLLIVLTAGLFLYIMAPFIVPVVVASIFAAGLNPLVERLKRKGLKRHSATIIVFSGFISTIFLPLAFFIWRAAHLVYGYFHRSDYVGLQVQIKNIALDVCDFIEWNYGIGMNAARQTLIIKLHGIEDQLYQTMDKILRELPEFGFLYFIGLLALYFFLKDADKIRPKLLSLSASTSKTGEKILTVLNLCARDIFITNIMTGLAQAVIVSVGAFLLGTGDFFVVFVCTFFLSFIPIIGAAPVAVFLGLLSIVENQMGPGFGMLAIACFAGVSDNILAPYLISRGTIKIHPFINFLSVLGGVIMFGFAGIFIGPFIVGIFFGATPLIFKELINTQTESSPLP